MPTQNRSFGSIRRLPSKRWQARYSTPDGTRYTAPHTFDTKRDANDWLADARTKMLRGSWVDPTASATTFGTYADDWLSTRTLAPRTRDLYRYQLDRWADTPVPAPGGGTVHLYALEMGHLTLPAIRRWYGAVLAAAAASASTAGPRDRRNPARVWADSDPGRAALAAEQITPPRPTGRLSPAVLDAWTAAGSPPIPTRPRGTGHRQATQIYGIVRAICATAVDDGLLNANPCRIPRAGITRAAERPIVTTADVHELAANMPEHLCAAVHLAVWSGLRASELFALDRSRVDLDAGSLRVDRSQIVIRGKFHGYGPPKSDAGNRVVHIPPHVVAMLRDHIRDHTRPGRSALIFARPDTGGPIVDPVRTRAFAKARAAIGRPELRWHDLRHSGATLAAHAGATPRELQHRFGHSTAAAASIYQHATAQRDRELAHRMAGYAAEPPQLRVVAG
ncbi:tyrosine-type recombinase/integrase [Rhodococcus triatomae]